MQHSPTFIYDQAVGAYNEATANVKAVVAPFVAACAGVGEKLTAWWQVVVLNNKDFPAAIWDDSKTQKINPAEWPSLDQLTKVLVEWHRAMEVAREAWLSVPEFQRLGRVGPEALPK